MLNDLGLNKKEYGNSRIVISPHAGYVFSGMCMAKVYNNIPKNIRNILILGTNHTGLGNNFSQSIIDWKTPLGIVNVNKEKVCDVNELAHKHEHSIEVQLPFLQYKLSNFVITPVVIKDASYNECLNFTKKIKNFDLVICSSDLTHYGPNYGYYKDNDKKALEFILKLKPKKFYEFSKNTTICGRLPITIGLILAKKLNLSPKLVCYYKSSQIHPSDSWVGYSGIIFK